MLGLNAKRGVVSTLERVFEHSGNQIGDLSVMWTGTTAGINFRKCGGKVNVKLIFPSIDERKDVSNNVFQNLIGYAVHELGHAWFTDNDPWDDARNEHGKFVSSLINGLEDPRIERKVIESGYAPNSRALFEYLTNSVLTKSGAVDANDYKNIPFLLAIEGRRLNGYAINVPDIVDSFACGADIRWALTEAQTAKSTYDIVDIAVELYKRIKSSQPPIQPPPPSDDGDDEDGNEDGEDGDGDDVPPSDDPVNPDKPIKPDGDGDGGDEDVPPTDTNPDTPSDKPSDGDGQDGDGQDGNDGEGNGKGDKPSDKPSNETGEDDGGQGSGKGLDGGREVEPNGFIEDELKASACDADFVSERPVVLKPTYATFKWE